MNQIASYDTYADFKKKLYVFIIEKQGDPAYTPIYDVLVPWATDKQNEIVEENKKSRGESDTYNPYWDYTDGACAIYNMCRRGEPYEQGRYHAYDPSNPHWKDFEEFLEYERRKKYDPTETLSAIAARTKRSKQAVFVEFQEFFDNLHPEEEK